MGQSPSEPKKSKWKKTARGEYQTRVKKGEYGIEVTATGYEGEKYRVVNVDGNHVVEVVFRRTSLFDAFPVPEPLPRWEPPPVWQPKPALIIGLGGTGRHVLTHLKKNLLDAGVGKIDESVRLILLDAADYELLEGEEVPVEFTGVALEPKDIVELSDDLWQVKENMRFDETAEPELRGWFPLEYSHLYLTSDDLNLEHGTRQRRFPARAALIREIRKGISIGGIEVVLAIDCSESMEAPIITSDSQATIKLDAAKHAARLFVDQLDLAVDRVAIVQFNDSAKVLCPLSKDRSAIQSAIAAIEPGGETSIQKALETAKGVIRSSSQEGSTRIIVLLSEGHTAPDSVPEIANELKRQGVRLVTVGIGDVDEYLMRQIASKTSDGDDYFYCPDATVLNQLYITLARNFGQGSRIWRLLHGNAHTALDDDSLRVILVGSLAGGFGSAIITDLAYLARRVGYSLGAKSVSVEAYLATFGAFSRMSKRTDLHSVNTYAALRELERFQLAQGRPFRMVYRTDATEDPILNGIIDWRLLDDVYLFDTSPEIPPSNQWQEKAYYDPAAGIFPAMADSITLWLDKAARRGILSDYRRSVQGNVSGEQRARGSTVIGTLGSFIYRLPMYDLVEQLNSRWCRTLLYRLIMGTENGNIRLDPNLNQEASPDEINELVEHCLLGKLGFEDYFPASANFIGNLPDHIRPSQLHGLLSERLFGETIEEAYQFRIYLSHVLWSQLNGLKTSGKAVIARGGKFGFVLLFLERFEERLSNILDNLEAASSGLAGETAENADNLLELVKAFVDQTKKLSDHFRKQISLVSARLWTSEGETQMPGLYERLEVAELERQKYWVEMDTILVREYIHPEKLLDQWYQNYMSDPDAQDENLARLHWVITEDGLITLALTAWDDRPHILGEDEYSHGTFIKELMRLAGYVGGEIWEKETLASVLAQTALHPENIHETANRLEIGSKPLIRYRSEKADRALWGLVLGANPTVTQANDLVAAIQVSLVGERRLMQLETTDPYSMFLIQMLDVIPITAMTTYAHIEQTYRRWYGLLPGVSADLRAEPTPVFRAERVALTLEQRLMTELRQSARTLRPIIVTGLDSGDAARLYALAAAVGWITYSGLDVTIKLPDGNTINLHHQPGDLSEDPLHPIVIGFLRFGVRATPTQVERLRAEIGSINSNVNKVWQGWDTPDWQKQPLAATLLSAGPDAADMATVITLVVREELQRRRQS